MSDHKTVGFIGLGVMGEPICRNLVWKSGTRVIAFDLAAEPLARLEAEGAGVATSVADLVRKCQKVLAGSMRRLRARGRYRGRSRTAA